MEQTEIKRILICPKCKGDISLQMKCMNCGASYDYKYGIYNILYEDIGEDYMFSTWNLEKADMKQSVQKYAAFQKEYDSYLNHETIAAKEKQCNFVKRRIKEMQGTVLDIATGRGMFLEEILSCNNDKIQIICSDIDARILAVTKETRHTGNNVSYIGMDGRHMSLADSCIDHVVSYVGIANMPDTELVIKEIHRVLKNGGTFLYKGMFLDKASKSYEKAKEYGVEKALDMEILADMFRNSEFSDVQTVLVAEAMWGENPHDGLPLEGDLAKYGVIEAIK